jgi:ArsR family transcriptional regulator, arsenate/arsenite/antimonite-responsive transcriptional repressor
MWKNRRMSLMELMPVRDVTACCSPLTREAISEENASNLASSLRALADPARLRIISMVAAHQDAEACVCDLTEPLGLGQPTVSHHLKILAGAGLVHGERRGKWVYYSLDRDGLAALRGALGIES